VIRRALALLALALQAPAWAAPPASDQEIGGRLGLALNLGGLGTGGAGLGGVFLYRVAEAVWIDSRAQVTAGGGGKDCYLARDRSVTCDPATVSGAAITLLVGPRVFLAPVRDLTPHLGGGAGVSYAVLAADDLAGIALPLWVSGGARRELRPGLWLGGELLVTGGPAHFTRGQGWGPFVAISAFATLDFGL
jgi:hypothetical protein